MNVRRKDNDLASVIGQVTEFRDKLHGWRSRHVGAPTSGEHFSPDYVEVNDDGVRAKILIGPNQLDDAVLTYIDSRLFDSNRGQDPDALHTTVIGEDGASVIKPDAEGHGLSEVNETMDPTEVARLARKILYLAARQSVRDKKETQRAKLSTDA